MSSELEVRLLKEKLLEYLREDVGFGDITSNSIIPTSLHAEAAIIINSDGVVAGVRESSYIFQIAGIEVVDQVDDGVQARNGQEILRVRGAARSILTVERTALNILMRMSGIASLTHSLVEEARSVNPKIRIACTRKTTPGFRLFEKRAVELGGGDTHRLRLDDAILIKSNHIATVGGVEEAIKRAKLNASFTKKIEVEVTSLDQAVKAAKLEPDILMLDNMSPHEVAEVTKRLREMGLRDKLLVEVSGGVAPDTLKTYAKTEVDIISMGMLTHSAKALNINLKITKTWSSTR
nr:carboxylating nicotinate-nucleotide diphosphorylase [Candidatus Njordarchaeum guaymaensis]